MSCAALNHRSSQSRRAGFTIVEFLLVVVILGVVMAVMATAFQKQQRFVTKTTSLTGVRAQMRQAAAVLPAELRAVSRVGGDIYAMTSRSLDIRAGTGGSMICRIPVVGSAALVIPPQGDVARVSHQRCLPDRDAGSGVRRVS